MVEFNPDGSLKLPGQMARRNEEKKEKLRKQRCIKIKRDVVNFTAPKKCVLHITLSEAFSDNKFIENIYRYFNADATVPNKIKKINETQFEVEIGSEFKRCSECNALINRYREFLDGNIIEEKGSCTFEGQKRNFCYEDYFD